MIDARALLEAFRVNHHPDAEPSAIELEKLGKSISTYLATLPASKEAEATEIGYTNWRGEYAIRKIVPRSIWFGSTEWHPEPQWLITAHDVEKGADRDFALSGFANPTPTATGVSEAMVREAGLFLIDRLAEFERSIEGDWPFVEFNGHVTPAIARLRAVQHHAWHPIPCRCGEGGAKADIAAERRRQIEAEGWTPEHDDTHNSGELAAAAACYARGDTMVRFMVPDPEFPSRRVNSGRKIWPWSDEWWKPSDERRNLVKAGALIAAEIERLDRLSASTAGGGK